MIRRRIDLIAPPMSGHLHPILGIGRRLARDYDVRILSTSAAQAEIAIAGLAGHSLLAGADEVISAIVNPPYGVRSNPWRLHAQFSANLGLAEQLKDELITTWRESPPDLVIADFTIIVAGRAADDCGIPWWTATPSSVAIETPDGPPAYLGGWRPMPGAFAHVRDAAGRVIVRTFKRGIHLLYHDRLTRLGFPSVYRADGTEAIYSPQCVLALGIAELEFPRSYPPAVEFVGPVLYSPPGDAPDPVFVDGRQHVLVTLGTHSKWRRDAVIGAVHDAARQLPSLEFRISDGDRTSTRHESTANVHRIGFVSYTRHLSRYALVVHHAGSGVMAHTLAAGIPAIAMPVDFDQFDYAARLEVAGAGVRLKRLRDLPRLVARVMGDDTI
ncbi:MAG TPA: glycosyltransferase, partial [Gemmatimonadaceae bacterium]|nr:glycosyltransferase [Gemmatimonadaceae bacterium]